MSKGFWTCSSSSMKLLTISSLSLTHRLTSLISIFSLFAIYSILVKLILSSDKISSSVSCSCFLNSRLAIDAVDSSFFVASWRICWAGCCCGIFTGGVFSVPSELELDSRNDDSADDGRFSRRVDCWMLPADGWACWVSLPSWLRVPSLVFNLLAT